MWRYSLCEDILLLRLTSELVDLRKGYANSFVLRTNGFESNNASTKRKRDRVTAGVTLSLFGRSVEIRTPGLQYPKLARYQLRYTSKKY